MNEVLFLPKFVYATKRLCMCASTGIRIQTSSQISKKIPKDEPEPFKECVCANIDYTSYQTRMHPKANQGSNIFSAKREEIRQTANKEHVIMHKIKN